MRSRIGIRLGLVIAFVAMAVFAATTLAAGTEECRRECQATFADDLAACADAFSQASAEIDAQYQACVDSAQSFFDRLRCLVERESAMDQAKLDRQRCEHAAENDLAQCLLDCESSPATP